MVYARDVEAAELALAVAQHAYLTRFGWSLTCDFPGSLWVWKRDFAEEDAARHARWVRDRWEHPDRQPPRGESTKHGVVGVPLTLAMDITRRALDQRTEDEEHETCLACRESFEDDDQVLSDVSGEYIHARCCGPERESYVKDVGTGEALGADDALPTGFRWGDR